jgi:hypothetical protein
MITPRQHGLLAALCLLPTLLSAQVQEGKELVMLDPKQLVHEIAINSTVATTITFPDKITLLTGFGLVQDPAAAKNMEQNRVALVHSCAKARLRDANPKCVHVGDTLGQMPSEGVVRQARPRRRARLVSSTGELNWGDRLVSSTGELN